ncbi:MAG TPA: SHOCT domain-containing protein [Leptolyngbyaceae cyanobacterium]
MGAIADIESQHTKWQGCYLPKLRQFVAQVDSLPDDHVNYPYRLRVVGSRGTDINSAKEGVINRFLAEMEKRVRALSGQNTVTSNTALPESRKPQPVIAGELVESELVSSLVKPTTNNDSSEQNSEDVVTQLDRLAKLREQRILSEAEFQNAKKKIFGF